MPAAVPEKSHTEETGRAGRARLWPRETLYFTINTLCLFSRHLVTLYFINLFNHRKWVTEVFSEDSIILVEKNIVLLFKFWVILFCLKALGMILSIYKFYFPLPTLNQPYTLLYNQSL